MKKIAYIEIDTHAEIAANFLQLMQDSDSFSVDYFFSIKILEQIDFRGPNVFHVDHRTLLPNLINKNYDLVIIGTAHRHFKLFLKISEVFRTAVVVHNLNFIQLSSLQLFKNIFKKDFIFRLKLLFKESLLSAPKVFEKASTLLVLDEILKEENQNLSLKFLPVFYFRTYVKPRNSVTTIVVPGGVSQQRRDYRHVLNCLKNFQQKRHYQFVFLGKASGRELSWIKEFENSKPQHISLKYFTEKVPQPIFDEWMQKADVLWCPLQKETEFFSQKEIYGITKMTGNVGDAIKYGKLAIFPEDYPYSYPFIISESINNEQAIISAVSVQNYDFGKNFSQEKILESLEKTLRCLI